MRLDLRALHHRVGERKRGGVQHLARHGHEARVARALEAERAVAHHGIADAGEVAADLVCATRLDADAQEGRVGARRLARDVRESALAVERRVNGEVRVLEASRDDGEVGLRHAVRLEHLHGGEVRLVVLREEEAASRVAVEPVDRLERRFVQLGAEDGLDAVRVAARDDAGGLVRHHVKLRIHKHAHMAALRRRFGGELLRHVRALLALGGGDDGAGDLHRVAGLEGVVRDPHAAPVHPHAASVDNGLGRAAREAEARSKEILERLRSVRLVDKEDFDVRCVARGLSHGYTRMTEPTTPVIFLPWTSGARRTSTSSAPSSPSAWRQRAPGSPA